MLVAQLKVQVLGTGSVTFRHRNSSGFDFRSCFLLSEHRKLIVELKFGFEFQTCNLNLKLRASECLLTPKVRNPGENFATSGGLLCYSLSMKMLGLRQNVLYAPWSCHAAAHNRSEKCSRKCVGDSHRRRKCGKFLTNAHSDSSRRAPIDTWLLLQKSCRWSKR